MSRHMALFLLVLYVGLIGKFAGADTDHHEEQEKSTPGPLLGAVVLAECYSCISCPNVGEQTLKKACPYHSDPLKAKKCVKFSERYPLSSNSKNASWVIRGCATERGSCEDIKKAYSHNGPNYVQLEYCTECEGDNCNNVSRSLPDMFFSFFAVVLIPIFAKYTLS